MSDQLTAADLDNDSMTNLELIEEATGASEADVLDIATERAEEFGDTVAEELEEGADELAGITAAELNDGDDGDDETVGELLAELGLC